jgi:mono/diheme cytochrome c family protein
MFTHVLEKTLLVACALSAVAEQPAPAKVNPVHPTAQSQARAKAIYGYDCAICHGANGDGKGEINADGKMKMRDLRDPASLKDFTDGGLYALIADGKGDIPSNRDRAKPDAVWNLVIYLRSMAKAGRG